MALDAEGCIALQKSVRRQNPTWNPVYHAHLEVYNTSRTLLEVIEENFGGTIKSHKRRNPRHKPSWVWKVGERTQVRRILQFVRPLLVVKTEQANLVIGLIDRQIKALFGLVRKRNEKLQPIEIAWREAAYQRMKVLNKKGVSPATTERTDSRLAVG